jgi:catechol-2,3-dioxygenase
VTTVGLVKLAIDRPRSHWLDANGEIVVQAEPFDPRDLVTDTTTPNGVAVAGRLLGPVQ